MGLIAAGLGAASLAGQIFAGIQGGKANQANQNLLNKQLEENEAFYNLNVNRDFLETNAAKGMFEQLRKQIQEANKNITSTAAVTGATPEAEIAEKTKVQEKYNEAVSGLAQGATRYQQGQEAIYRGEKGRLTEQQMFLNQQKAEQAANLAGNAGNVMESATTLTGFEDVANKIPILSPGNMQNLKNIEPYRGILLGN